MRAGREEGEEDGDNGGKRQQSGKERDSSDSSDSSSDDSDVSSYDDEVEETYKDDEDEDILDRLKVGAMHISSHNFGPKACLTLKDKDMFNHLY